MADAHIPVAGTVHNLETFRYQNSENALVDREGVFIGSASDGSAKLELVNADNGYSVPVVLGEPTTKTLRQDAWGRDKVVFDKSLFHGLFTVSVPVSAWRELLNDVELTAFGQATSESGKLVLASNGVLNDKVRLSSFRHPRYEPNRGHLYSSTEWFDDPNALAEATWGIFYEESGCGFRLRNGQLYGVLRTTVSGVTDDTEYPISLPANVDLTKGNLFDIQFQWRGVGDYFFFVNKQLVFQTEDLGTRTELSIFNPASPVSYEVINLGEDITMYSGCVDVTSEGGSADGKTYGSVSTETQSGQVAISGFNQPIIAVRSKTSVNSLVNTRDTLALLATAYADQKSVFRVWATRDSTAITLNDQAWTDFGDGHLEYLVYNNPTVATPMTFDTAKAQLIFGARVNQDTSYATSALFEGRTDIFQTPGDIFIFTMHRETGGAVNAGVTYEFAEAI